MTKFERDLDITKNKIAEGVKEAAGKITGNQQLELKGKMQTSKAEIKKNTNIADRIEDIKEDIAASINDRIDKNKKNSRKRK